MTHVVLCDGVPNTSDVCVVAVNILRSSCHALADKL